MSKENMRKIVIIMDRALKTLLDVNELNYNECDNTIRMVNDAGISVMFDTDTSIGEAENFTSEPIDGLANTIRLLKQKERC